jgi:polysaccharide export outer membrane protein
MNRSLRLVLAFVVGSAVAGCATGPSAPTSSASLPGIQPTAASGGSQPTASSPSASTAGALVPAVVGVPHASGSQSAYRISAGDVMKIDVFQVEELSTEERVGDDGSIIMPLIGQIAVAGLTPAQAEARIAAALQKDYLQNPQVNIFVSEYAAMDVTVGGAVKKPGVFPLSGQTTLLHAIAQAEGVTDMANEREVVIFRRTTESSVNAYVVDLKQVEQGKLSDPVLVSNDKVMVPESGSAVFLKGLSDTLRGFVRLPIY